MKKLVLVCLIITTLMILNGFAFGITFESGSITTVAHSKVDAAAVAAWKATALDIEAGGVYNKLEFQPTEASMWKNGSVWSEGGMAAYITTISDLQADDIIVIAENQQWKPLGNTAFESFNAYTSYVKVSSYTHNSTNTILNWLNYINDNGDGSFTFVKGSAVFEVTNDGIQPASESIIGIEYRIDRTLTVLRGATLISPGTNSRGYIAGTGVSGGTAITADISAVEFTIIPEPATMLLIAIGGLILRKRS